MARRWMRNGWLMTAVLLALALPAKSWAITGNLQFYENSVGQGNTLGLLGPVAGQLLDLRYNASSADGLLELGNPDGQGERAGIFDFSIIITTTGDVTLDAFACNATGCFPPQLTANSLTVR